jgi:hypothetical protein
VIYDPNSVTSERENCAFGVSDEDEIDDRPLWEQELASDPDDDDHRYQIERAFSKRESREGVDICWQQQDRLFYEATGTTVMDADHPAVRMDETVTRRGACDWCGEDPRNYSDGLCRPCHVYRKKYGVFPEPEVIDRRLDRRVAKGSQLRSYTNR